MVVICYSRSRLLLQDAMGNNVTPAANTFQLLAGNDTTITLNGVDPSVVYSFNTSGLAGTASAVL